MTKEAEKRISDAARHWAERRHLGPTESRATWKVFKQRVNAELSLLEAQIEESTKETFSPPKSPQTRMDKGFETGARSDEKASVMTDDDVEALAKKHIATAYETMQKLHPRKIDYQHTEQFRRVKALLLDALGRFGQGPVASVSTTYAAPRLAHDSKPVAYFYPWELERRSQPHPGGVPVFAASNEVGLSTELDVVYVDAGHLREVLAGNEMPVYATTEKGHGLVGLVAADSKAEEGYTTGDEDLDTALNLVGVFGHDAVVMQVDAIERLKKRLKNEDHST